MNDYIKKLGGIVKAVREYNYYPEIPHIEGVATEPTIKADGKEFLSFSSNNYLGMSSHSEVKEAMIQAVKEYGMGSGGSRLLTGNIHLHRELEVAIANYTGREDAITFTTGYMANIGTIPAVINLLETNFAKIGAGKLKKKLGFKKVRASIISDEKNHGSIIDAVRLSGAEKLIYKHTDMKDLERSLKKAKNDWKLIVTDGVFSMDGDIAPLPEIIKLAKKYNAMLMVDDAHGIGVIGKNGGGIIDHFDANQDDVDILLGTFTKAFGGIGGFVTGKKELIEYLRITARTHILSAPVPPSISAGLLKSIELLEKDPTRRKIALENAAYFRKAINEIGLNTLGSETLIVPVLVGPEEKVIQISKDLKEKGILAPNVRYPAVSWGASRLRFAINTLHSREEIDRLITSLKEIKQLHNL